MDEALDTIGEEELFWPARQYVAPMPKALDSESPRVGHRLPQLRRHGQKTTDWLYGMSSGDTSEGKCFAQALGS